MLFYVPALRQVQGLWAGDDLLLYDDLIDLHVEGTCLCAPVAAQGVLSMKIDIYGLGMVSDS